MEPQKIVIDSVELDEKKVLTRLGYNPFKTTIDPATQLLIDSLIEHSGEWIKPKGIYRTEEVTEYSDEHVVVGASLRIESKDVAKLLINSSFVSVFAVTIGSQVSDEIQSCMDSQELTKATIIDGIASESVEALASWMNIFLRTKSATSRAQLTKRYSPGYGNWSVSGQEEILTFVSAHNIGITLSRGGVMLPEKSVTALVGWEKKG